MSLKLSWNAAAGCGGSIRALGMFIRAWTSRTQVLKGVFPAGAHVGQLIVLPPVTMRQKVDNGVVGIVVLSRVRRSASRNEFMSSWVSGER